MYPEFHKGLGTNDGALEGSSAIATTILPDEVVDRISEIKY